MEFTWVLLIMVVATGAAVVANRRGIATPLVLVALGMLVSLIPQLPHHELSPETILTLLVPPLIFSAAMRFSLFDFMRRLRDIANLGVVLIVITALVIGLLASVIVPGLTLPAALVLGAIVSPPDAVTAQAIGSRLGLPRRVMSVLTGESLVNDAAALALFAVLVAGVTGGSTFISQPVLYFGYAAVAGLVIGLAFGAGVQWLRLRIAQANLVTALTLLTPFVVYLVAEQAQAAGVIAVVATGIVLGQNSDRLDYAARIQNREVWDVVDTLLELFVFAYMGLQLPQALRAAVEADYSTVGLLLASLAILVAVIVVRIAWVMGSCSTGMLYRRLRQRFRTPTPTPRAEVIPAQPPGAASGRVSKRRKAWATHRPEPLTPRESLVVSWSGMRGIVTIATAAGVPLTTLSGAEFPGREAIQVVAYIVAVGTLLLQGTTLPWVIKRAGVSDARDADQLEAQRRLAAAAQHRAKKAVMREILASGAESRYSRVLDMVSARMEVEPPPETIAAAKQRSQRAIEVAERIAAATRRELIAERDAGRLDEMVLREQLEDLDWREASLGSQP